MPTVAWCRVLAVSICGLAYAGPAFSQVDPRTILQGVIQQLSTGTPNPTWYGPQLWQTIAAQTGNSGIYPQLVAAGAPTNITVVQQQQMPQGFMFRLRSQHATGAAFEWLLGISSMSNRIEYMSSNPLQSGGPGPNPNPYPSPGPAPAPGPSPNPGPTTIPPGGSACQKFPDLC